MTVGNETCRARMHDDGTVVATRRSRGDAEGEVVGWGERFLDVWGRRRRVLRFQSRLCTYLRGIYHNTEGNGFQFMGPCGVS